VRRRPALLLVVLALAAGCGGAQAAAVDVAVDCQGRGSECVLLGADDVTAVWPVEADFEEVTRSPRSGGVRWCDAPAPVPLETAQRVLLGADLAGSASWAVVTTVGRFAAGDAQAYVDVIRSLPAGCEWSEAGESFQFLDGIELRHFAAASVAVLLRVETDEGGQNVEQVVVRQGDRLATATVVPALDRPALLDALGSVLAARLESLD